MIKALILLIATTLATANLALPATIHAQSADAQERQAINCDNSGDAWDETSGNCVDCTSSFLGLPSWHRYLEKESKNGRCEIVGPASQEDPTQLDWPRVVGYVSIAVVEILLRIASLIAVAYVVYGGFRYITSQGDPENAKSARQTIINAIIGLVIAIASASIVSFLGNRLG